MKNQSIKNLTITTSFYLLAAAAGLTGCALTPEDRSTTVYNNDATIAATVETRLVADPAIRPYDIKVHSDRGRVFLNGYVDSQDQKVKIDEIARNSPGARLVENNVVVGLEPAGAEPDYIKK